MSAEAPSTPPPAETFEKVTISLPKRLLAGIDQLAARDRRSRSNFIVCAVEDIVNAGITAEPAAETSDR